MADKEYLNLCKTILENGITKDDRTGVGTKSIFGYQMKFDLNKGFPLLTTKKINFNLVWSELLWFIKGDTNIKFLLENKNNIWNEWAFKKWIESEEYTGPDMTDFGHRVLKDKDFAEEYKKQMNIFKENILNDDNFSKKFGDLGNVYGKQWRNFNGVDQLKNVIEQIKINPSSRRLIVSAWNPAEVDEMALPPCHCLFQFYVADGRLSLQLYQRSADTFLGVPFNIASYALLLQMMAQVTGLEAGEFIHTTGDTHLYSNHLEQAKLQLTRTPRPLPKMKINPDVKDLFAFKYEDFELVDYNPYPHISAEVAV